MKNQSANKNVLFESMPIPKAVANLAIPTILSSLVMVLYNLADTYFVGMLNDPLQNAAVTLAAPVLLAFNAVNNLFGGNFQYDESGSGTKRVRYSAKKFRFGFLLRFLLRGGLCRSLYDMEESAAGYAGRRFGDGAGHCGLYALDSVLGAVPAILNVVLAYLVRSEGASLHASMGTMSGCLLNIVLDPIFIMPWGLGMGAAGAGLATFLSNCVACGYFLVLLYLKRGSTYVCINPRMLGWNKAIVLGICGVGIPASIQNLLNVTGMTILNNFTSEYGADAVAAMGISQKISMVPLQIALGFSQGIMPLISYNYASGNHPRMKKAITFAMKLMLPALFGVMALFWIFSAGLTRTFMDNEAIITYGTRFLRGFSLAMPFLGMDFLTVGVFQALGKGRNALIFALMRKIILEIPALFILNRLFPLYGLPYAQPFAEMVLAAAAAFMLRRIFRQCNLQHSN